MSHHREQREDGRRLQTRWMVRIESDQLPPVIPDGLPTFITTPHTTTEDRQEVVLLLLLQLVVLAVATMPLLPPHPRSMVDLYLLRCITMDPIMAVHHQVTLPEPALEVVVAITLNNKDTLPTTTIIQSSNIGKGGSSTIHLATTMKKMPSLLPHHRRPRNGLTRTNTPCRLEPPTLRKKMRPNHALPFALLPTANKGFGGRPFMPLPTLVAMAALE
jgi:hypothetical protein